MSFEFSNPLDGLASRGTLAAHGQRVLDEFGRRIESIPWIEGSRRPTVEHLRERLYECLRLHGRVIFGLPRWQESDVYDEEEEELARDFIAWLQRQEDGVARFESTLQRHPRALLILHSILDTFSDAIEALATTATEELNELRAIYGDIAYCPATPRTYHREKEIFTLCDYFEEISRNWDQICSLGKMHDLDAARAIGQPHNTLVVAAINRIQQVTENYISEKLPQTSAPIRNALVRANIARLEYILNTQTHAQLPTESSDTYIQPYICLHERCCSDRDDEQQQLQQTFGDPLSWARHMWKGLHHVDWWLCDPPEQRAHTPVRFDDVEAFREHIYLEHGIRGGHCDGGCQDQPILSTALNRARRAEQDPISRCMLCHNAHNCEVPEGAQNFKKLSPFNSAEVQQHVAEHLRDVADLAYREACAVLPLLPPREPLPATTNSRGARNILHHMALEEDGKFLEALMFTGGRDFRWLVEQPDTRGRTPLHYAARSHFGVRFLCILLGELKRMWCRPCHAHWGDILPQVVTEAHLAERRRLLSLRDNFGQTPLLVAVMHNQYPTLGSKAGQGWPYGRAAAGTWR
ncbi:hypothetical protein NLG97_g5841 [Lecanicillium saksenae]|uniref:Uncharacterized protein n=1 Tax=Lecanicillium saksenae TaxID=468837 RepID=A0ACC1QRA6_9HYPO|nr:hypothetical protein NLG97_g5841 [Lecanicillium saksenae]